MSPFEAYKLYIAIKQHFSSPSYDFFKYNGKVKVSADQFETRKDKYMFYKLSKRDDALEYLVAILSQHSNVWVGEMFEPKYEEMYMVHKKRQESLSYVFKNDIDNLLEDFDKNFEVIDGQYPHLLNLFVRKKITKETLIILNDCVKFAGRWNKQISDTVLWPAISTNCKKLFPFMSYDKDKYCIMLREKFS